MTPLTPRGALWRGAAALFFYLSIPSLMLGFVMVLLSFPNTSVMPDEVTCMVSAAGYVIALWLILRKLQREGVPLVAITGKQLRNTSRNTYLLMIAAGVALGLAVAALLTLLPIPTEQRTAYDAAALASFEGSGKLVAALMAIVFSPLSEELFFRGILLRTLRRGLPCWVALVLSSVLFGVMHLQLVWVIYASCMGLLFGWLTLHTDNLGTAIAVHFGFNLASLPGVLANGSVWYQSLGSNTLLLWLLLVGGGIVAMLLLRIVIATKNEGSLPE